MALNFCFGHKSDSGKTTIWYVYSTFVTHAGETLGRVAWYGPWRKYVFYPSEGTLFDPGCLTEIATFLSEENRKHKEK